MTSLIAATLAGLRVTLHGSIYRKSMDGEDAKKERAREIKRRWHIKNREKVLARVKAWSLANPERRRAIQRKWKATHQDWIREYNQRPYRKAKLREYSKTYRERKKLGQTRPRSS